MTDNENALLKKIYEIVCRLEQWKDDQETSIKQFWEKDWKELMNMLNNHDRRIRKLERWQAMSVGIAITCSTFLAFLIKMIKF